jgi:hypothetical protein
MSISETNDILTWSIDRTPDYDIYNNIDIIDTNDNIDEIEYEFYRNIVDTTFQNLQTNIINNFNYNYNNTLVETEEFIPFQNNTVRPEIEVENDVVDIFNEEIECCICMETRENFQMCHLNCRHKFCDQCIQTHISANRAIPSCPLCRNLITNIKVQCDDVFQRFKNI